MEHPAIPTTRFVQRRQRLQDMMNGAILLMGNCESPHASSKHSRFDKIPPFGITQVSINPMPLGFPVLRDILFLPTQHPSDVLWHGSA